MGASESKLVFKQGIFRLTEDTRIPPDDPYWTSFWELPESVEDVFSLFSPTDIRRTRDTSLENLETLILALTSRLSALRRDHAFPDPELAPARDALNCVRILTRILPFIYEAENLSEWEDNFFWARRRRRNRPSQIPAQVLFDHAQTDDSNTAREEDALFRETNPLAEELIDNLTDLLFYSGFTIPPLPNAKNKVTYAIWQSGVGCKTPLGTNKELESNRCEVLRLLLTISGKSMYMSSNTLPVQGVKAITYMATCSDKQIVLSVLCSLLNTTIKYNATTWHLPYDHVVWKDPKQSLVIYSLQFLLVLILYPIPEEGRGPPPKNFYRHFFGRLHRPEDFQFLAEGMTRILGQPMQATSSYLPGSQKSVKWAPEMIMLFWEMLQCNKRFRSFIIESNRAHDFIILMLFYAIEHKTDTASQGIVRMCVFVLQTMSVEPAFGRNLNQSFEAQETLPPSIRISHFKGTYADFLIASIHTLITGSKGKLDAIYPALLAIINNIAAYAQDISNSSSSKLLQLFVSMSAPSFLLANDTNHLLLQSLLESINTMIEHQYSSNANLIYAVLKNKKRIEALRMFTLESGQEEIERIARRRKEILNGGSAGSDLNTNSTTQQTNLSRTSSMSLTNVPEEEGTFRVGDSDDSDNDFDQPTPSQSSTSNRNSRAASIASSVEDSVPIQLRGMSEKARGKMPAGSQTFSRQNSTASLNGQTSSSHMTNSASFTPTPQWLHTWLPELPLHTMLTLIKALSPHMPSAHTSTIQASPSLAANADSRRSSYNPESNTASFLSDLPHTTSHPLIASLIASPSPIRVHLFEWSALSLGWYESLLWSLIYSAEMLVGMTGGNIGGSVGPIGVWNGTNVKLFQVAEGKKEGPSLAKPRGAVDAVGSRLVQGVQGLNLKSISAGMRSVSGGGATMESGRREPSVREV